PLRRFVSGFLDKVFTEVDSRYVHVDSRYLHYRDMLTCLHGIDISPEADPQQSCLAFAKWIANQNPKSVDPHFRLQHLNLAIGTRFTIDTILRVEDKQSMLAYFAKWVGLEKAEWFLSLRVNEGVNFTHSDVTSDELEALVRKIYARDYELFYSEAVATDAA
ncbi:MAG TPA: sulfotransferase family 2 domain-containing protein, partial [Terriglobales bacterium]|nr:sulfotransferase family 2 domain-containing protein [Terriglobales bacterium]